jgi:hypothetical protein
MARSRKYKKRSMKKRRIRRKTRKGGGAGPSSHRPNNISQKKSWFRRILNRNKTQRITPLEILNEESEEERGRREAEEAEVREKIILQQKLNNERRAEMIECIKTWVDDEANIENLNKNDITRGLLKKREKNKDDYLILILRYVLNMNDILEIECGDKLLTLKVSNSSDYYLLQGSYTPKDENTFVDLYDER